MDGAELRRRRNRIGLSQAALAEELGVTANTIARWERGELAIGSSKMVSLALNSLQTIGLRSAMADVAKKLPKVKVAYPDVRVKGRIDIASEQLRSWIERVLSLSDTDLERAVRSKSSFPGYRVLSRLRTDLRLNPTTRSDLSWATHSLFRALEIAQRIWSFSWLDVTTNPAARRKRRAV